MNHQYGLPSWTPRATRTPLQAQASAGASPGQPKPGRATAREPKKQEQEKKEEDEENADDDQKYQKDQDGKDGKSDEGIRPGSRLKVGFHRRDYKSILDW